MNFWKLLSLALVATFFSITARADDSTLQFYYGPVADISPNSIGLLVADVDGDGFLSLESPDALDTELYPSGQLSGNGEENDDFIVGIFPASVGAFGPDTIGFVGTVNGFDQGPSWDRTIIPAGTKLLFIWIDGETSPGDGLNRWLNYGSYRRDAVGTSGGDIGFVVPPDRHHRTLAVIGTEMGGDLDPTNPAASADFYETGQTGAAGETRIDYPTPSDDPVTSDSNFDDSFNGIYSGLITDSTSENPIGEGKLTMKNGPAFSGKFIIDNVSYTVKSLFSGSPATTSVVVESKKGPGPIQIDLEIATTPLGKKIIGTAIGSGVDVVIDLHQAAWDKKTNPAPHAGLYTFLLPVQNISSPILPGADGFGTAKIDGSGKVALKGQLGDLTKVSESSYISADGECPIWIPAYRKVKGFIGGKVTLRDIAESDFDGQLAWIKPAGEREKKFPAGFDIEQPIIGSLFIPGTERPTTITSSQWRNISVSFLGGQISPNPGSVSMRWHSDNRFEFYLPDRVSFKISASPKTGVIKGTWKDSELGLNLKLNGIVFQKQEIVGGAVLNGKISAGALAIDPVP